MERAAQAGSPVRYIAGRNFLESLVYTLTYLDFKLRLESGVDSVGMLARELERHVCSLALAMPQLKRIYHDHVGKILSDMEKLRSLPKPSLGPQCRVHDLLIAFFRKNRNNIFGVQEVVDSSDVEKQIEHMASEIVYQAVLGTLYSAGILSF